jgi:hypothetical protein
VEPYYLLQVVALRLGLSCKRSIVLSIASDDIAAHWDDAAQDMASALTLLRDECGVLIAKWLPYRPMLIPLAAAWSEIANATGPAQGARRAKLRRWFWCACFTGEYESSSASLAERDAPILKEWLTGDEEPRIVRDFGWNPERWRSVTPRQQGLYRATIALTLTNYPRDLHTAAPLTPELIEAKRIDDHHVFPRAFLRDMSRGAEVDSVLNHCLLDRATNGSIGKKPPSVYFAEIRAALGDDLDAVLRSQHLPVGSASALTTDDFDAFLTQRLEDLAEALGAETGSVGAAVQLNPQRAKLDARIESIERRIRALVLTQLGDPTDRLPSRVEEKASERLRIAARKQPGNDLLRQPTFSTLLEYFDLRDLQDTITAKALWGEFEAIFSTKEQLSARFMQLAELRNALRHSRALTSVTIKDGEAAILWFGDALRGAPASG